MPTYHVRLEAEKLISCRNYFAPTVWECIDKVIENEAKSDFGLIISMELDLVHK